MSNRLLHEGSCYMRQHADNPMDWYPWAEPFAKAKREGKPAPGSTRHGQLAGRAALTPGGRGRRVAEEALDAAGLRRSPRHLETLLPDPGRHDSRPNCPLVPVHPVARVGPGRLSRRYSSRSRAQESQNGSPAAGAFSHPSCSQSAEAAGGWSSPVTNRGHTAGRGALRPPQPRRDRLESHGGCRGATPGGVPG